MGTEATHMARFACKVVTTADMGPEAMYMAFSACEAVVIAKMGFEAILWRIQFAKLAMVHGTKLYETTHGAEPGVRQ